MTHLSGIGSSLARFATAGDFAAALQEGAADFSQPEDVQTLATIVSGFKMAGVLEINGLCNELDQLLLQPAEPLPLAAVASAASVRKSLAGIVAGVPQDAWGNIQRSWPGILAKAQAPNATSWTRRASLHGNPAQVVELLLSRNVREAIADHPLAGIVTQEGRRSITRILIWVGPDAKENRIDGLTERGFRLEIHLKGNGRRAVNRNLVSYLSWILRVPEGAITIASGEQNLQGKKSIVVAQLDLREVLNRLNEAGPKLIGKAELIHFEKDLNLAKKQLEGIEKNLKDAENLLKHVSETDQPTVKGIIDSLDGAYQKARDALHQAEISEETRTMLTRGEFDRRQEFLASAATHQQHFEALQAALIPPRLKFLIKNAVGILDEAEDYLKKIRPKVEDAQVIVLANVKDLNSYAVQLEADRKELQEIQSIQLPILKELSLEELVKIEAAVTRIITSATRAQRDFLEFSSKAELFLSKDSTPQLALPPLTLDQERKYGHLLPALNLLREKTQPDNQGHSPLSRMMAQIAARLVKDTSLVEANFSEGYWPGAIPAIMDHLERLTGTMRETVKETRTKYSLAKKGVYEEDQDARKVASIIQQGLGQIRALFGPFSQAEQAMIDAIFPKEGQIAFPKPVDKEGSLPKKRDQKPEKSFVQLWGEKSALLQEEVRRQQEKPFFMSDNVLRTVEDFIERDLPTVRDNLVSMPAQKASLVANPENPLRKFREAIAPLEKREEAFKAKTKDTPQLSDGEKDTLRLMREERDRIESKHPLAKTIETLEETFDQMIATIGKSVKRFQEAYAEFRLEHDKPEDQRDSVKLRKLFYEVRNLRIGIVKKMGGVEKVLTGKYKTSKKNPETGELIKDPTTGEIEMVEAYDEFNLQDLIRGSRPERRTKPITPDSKEIDGVKIDLAGHGTTQREKLQQIEWLLEIPNVERQVSVDLAFEMFKERVEEKIKRGEPLRRLVGMDETQGVAIIWDERFGTAFFVPWKRGWSLGDESRAVIPMFHGAGGARSTGKSMIAPMIKLRNDYGYSTLALDAPNHGLAVKDERFKNLDFSLRWTDSIINYAYFLAGGSVPVIGLGRSHGDNILEEFNVRQPGSLDGSIHVSGYNGAWTMLNLPYLNERIRNGDFKASLTGLPMVMAQEGLGVKFNQDGTVDFYPQGENQWTFLNPDNDVKRRQTPSVYLQGTRDQDYSNGVPLFYKEREARAQRFGFSFLTEVGGQHDLISLNTKSDDPEVAKVLHARMLRVYEFVYKFVEGIIGDFDSLLRMKNIRRKIPPT